MNLRFVLIFAVLMYGLLGALLFVFQRDFIYMPVDGRPHAYPVEPFLSGGETIQVVVLNPGKADAVIYFGGNAEWVVGNAPGFLHSFPEHSVYLVNYRGYGGSTGEPSERALYADAQHIHDALHDRHRSIALIGRSLGSGVATYLASVRSVSKLVLVTPFDSILRIAQDQYPIYPVSILLRDTYDSYSRVDSISAPTLVVLAEHDRVIPAKYAQRLIGAFPPDQVQAETIAGAGHNGLSARSGYYDLLARFISQSDQG